MRQILSSIEEQVFNFLVEYKHEHDGNSPTYREISNAVNKPSTSYISFVLDGLERKGYIRLSGTKPTRIIEVVGGVWKYADGQ